MRSAALVKEPGKTSLRSVRLERRKLKKAEAKERKRVKRFFPSPIDMVKLPILEEVDEVSAPTRAEMIQQAARINFKIDKRWSDETMLKKLNQASS